MSQLRNSSFALEQKSTDSPPTFHQAKYKLYFAGKLKITCSPRAAKDQLFALGAQYTIS